MWPGDAVNKLAKKVVLATQAVSGATTSSAIDLRNLFGTGKPAAKLFKISFVSKDTANGATCAWKIQSSSDDGAVDTYADVTGAFFQLCGTTGASGALIALPTSTTTPRDEAYIVDPANLERYLKIVATPSGATVVIRCVIEAVPQYA
jgi:hypothetical protein